MHAGLVVENSADAPRFPHRMERAGTDASACLGTGVRGAASVGFPAPGSCPVSARPADPGATPTR